MGQITIAKVLLCKDTMRIRGVFVLYNKTKDE